MYTKFILLFSALLLLSCEIKEERQLSKCIRESFFEKSFGAEGDIIKKYKQFEEFIISEKILDDSSKQSYINLLHRIEIDSTSNNYYNKALDFSNKIHLYADAGIGGIIQNCYYKVVNLQNIKEQKKILDKMSIQGCDYKQIIEFIDVTDNKKFAKIEYRILVIDFFLRIISDRAKFPATARILSYGS